MVDIVSGAGLGLFNTTANTLGGTSGVGPGSPGRNGERIAVNVANGNLLIQQSDERVSSLGTDLNLVRTYNSHGLYDGDNSDNWMFSPVRALINGPAFPNTIGSTVTKVFGDGKEVIYTYANGRYQSPDGDGAHDTIVFDGFTWTWTDGSGRNTEVYDAFGWLVAAFDTDGNRTSYVFDAMGRLQTVTDASGQVTRFQYSGSNVTEVRVTQPASQGGATQTLTRYRYDSSNRLRQVIVDLTPADNTAPLPDANGDGLIETVAGQTYITTYTYDGTSKRIASISQSDGSSVSFTYVTLNGKSRLQTYSVDDGTTTRRTTFGYTLFNSANGGIYQTVNVTDPLGRVTTYNHNTSGQLTSVLSPTVGTVRLQTRYTYDTSGNLLTIAEDPTGLNRVTTYTYDANGNQMSSRDNRGNTVTRTYNGNNQLLTETQFLVRDPDGAGTGQPTTPVTTRYVYDGESHLRFVITPEGRVTEHQYNTAGQRIMTRRFTGVVYTATAFAESDLATWAAARNLTQLERVDYAYDFRAQLTTTTAWSATSSTGAGSGTPSITRFVYDQRGNLLQTIEARGEATTTDATDFRTVYTYDGLNRLLTTTEWIATGQTRTTTNQYDDVGNRTVTTLVNGLVTTSTFNRAGELTSLVNSGPGVVTGTTTYKYDANGRLKMATDPTGVRAFNIYDEVGRLLGEVDGDGSLTEYVYSRFSQLVKTVRYATALTSTALASLVDASGNPTNVAIASIRPVESAADRITRNVYNNGGQLQYSLDEAGAVTEHFYDGAGRLTATMLYANVVTSIPRSQDQVLPGTFTIVWDSANDRRTRYFYDNDGNVVATLDSGGFLSEAIFDAVGNLTRAVSYANPTTASLRAAGTLAELRASVGTDNETTTDPERDATAYFFYDGQGRKVGELDAEGFLNETVYDVAGRVSQALRYNSVLTYATGATLASLKVAVPTTATRITTQYQYDGAGNVVSETTTTGTTTAFDSITTTYQYNSVGQLASATRASGTTEARTTQTRYDALGRVVQELSGEGSRQITAGMTQAQIDQIWDRYGVRYAYDAAGRMVSTTTVAFDPSNNTTQTNTSFFYYDSDDRLRFTVNARGEVAESRYNSLGQLTNTRTYTNRIATTGLTGGLLTPTLATALVPIADANRDATTAFEYALTGQVSRSSTAEGANVTFLYNAFGEERSRTESIDATRTRTTTSTYDTRGLLLSNRTDTAGFNLLTSQTYDAFGRLASSTDAMGRVSRFEYDRLGRVIATVDTLGGRRLTSYDAFARALTTRDALNNTTTYTYNDATRSTTVTTPEGVQVTTINNRHGQTLTVVAAGNTTTYQYNANGQIASVSDTLGALETRAYDSSGRLVTQTDGKGALTRFAYDAANRLLTRTIDPSGINVATTYQYDGQGRVTQVIEPGNRVTQTDYDNDGRVTEIRIDPAGLNLRTTFTYDLEGREITVTEGAGSTNPRITQYTYDTLGRRTQEVVDPGTGRLNLTTQYRYDGNGNVVRKIDARGASTWFVYDNADRLTVTVTSSGATPSDPLGTVTQLSYDAEGRVTATRMYSSQINTSTFATTDRLIAGSNLGLLTLQGSGTPVGVPIVGPTDRLDVTVYDRDGRAVYSVDAMGGVIERTFDANGNVTRTRAYANRVAVSPYTSIATLQSALSSAGNNVSTVSSNDRVSYAAYDLRGRAAFTVDLAGGVTQYQYDLADNVIATTRFAAPKTTGAMDLASMNTFAGANAGNARNQTTRMWYDAADRSRFTLDAEGFLHETRYNDGTRETRSITYSRKGASNVPVKPAIAAGATLAQVVSAAAAVASATHDEVTITVDDAAGRVSTVTDGMGGVTRYGYDATGNVLTVTDARNNVTTNTYDAAGRLRTKLSPESVLVTYAYDALGNVITLTRSFSSGSDARTTSYIYDALGRQTRLTDGEGYSTTFVYDTFGNQTSVTTGQYLIASGQPGYDANKANRATNLTSTAIFNRLDQVTTATDAEGSRTDYAYDAFGNRTSVIEAANGLYSTPARTTTYTYDNANRLTRIITPMGGEVRYGYDAFGNKTSEQTLQSAANTNGVVNRDASGNPISPVWINRTFDYNKRNQLSAAVDAYATRNETYYDAAGNVIEQRSAAGTTDQRSVKFEYDRAGRKSADVDGYGNRTTYAYDAVGNRIRVTKPADATGQIAIARYYYNRDNQLTTVLDPEGAINTFQYDSAGNKTQERVYLTRYSGTISDTTAPTPTSSSADRVVTTSYNRVNRAIITNRSEGTSAAPTTVQTLYVYDGTGQLLTKTDFADKPIPRVTRYTYLPSGRVQQMTVVGDLVTGDTVTTYTYDAVGNKRTQTVTNARDTANPVRQTAWTYDLENRVLTETFDPANLNIIKTNRYDAAGNVIHTEVNSPMSSGGIPTEDLVYDLNHRLTRKTDGMGNVTTYGYDRVGNRTSETNPNGNVAGGTPAAHTTNYVYDLNNRLTQTILPSVTIFTMAAGATSTTRPTTTNTYDNAGNLVQITDANGFRTTRYYDRNGRLTAELAHDDGVNFNANGTVMSDTDGDLGLCTYAYNTAGEVVTKVEYMQRLSITAQNPAVRPGAPTGGQVRTTTYVYDLAGRLIQTFLPAIDVTTLSGAEGETPTSTTANRILDERTVYNVYGDAVETYDRGGKRTVNYYDIWHRKVASVDPMGYLTEWDYDATGNKIAQRVYTQIVATPTPATRPAAPGGTVHLTNWTYDAASRLTAEVSPLVDVDIYSAETQNYTANNVRVVTTYLYDRAGNLRRKTVGAGHWNEQSEYYYYDRANRQIAMVDKNRVFSETLYDANGNITRKRRLHGAVSSGVDLLNANLYDTIYTSVLNDPQRNANMDQIHTYTYDAANRQKSETDQVQPGITTDDVTTSYEYDAVGNRTRSTDGDGFATRMHYDADGHVLKMLDARGNGTIFEYDVAGNLTRAYTGQSQSGAVSATNIRATMQNGAVVVDYNVGGASQQSWIVYDTMSRPSLNEYANLAGSALTANGAGQVTISGLNASTAYYFRVVTRDVAGNLAWSAEQTITIRPSPGLAKMDIVFADAPLDGAWRKFIARFNGPVVNPQLVYGTTSGSLTSTANLVAQADGSYVATIQVASGANPLANFYAVRWSDSAGAVHSSGEAATRPQKEPLAVTTTTNSTAITGGYRLNASISIASTVSAGFTSLVARWRPVGSTDMYTSSIVGRSSITASNGNDVWNFTMGGTPPLGTGTYEIVLSLVRSDGREVTIDMYNYAPGPNGTGALTQVAASWRQPPSGGDDWYVYMPNAGAYAHIRDLSRDGRLIVHRDPLAAGSSQSYDNIYSVQLESYENRPNTMTVTSSNTSGGPTNLTVTVTLHPAYEVNNINANGLRLSWWNGSASQVTTLQPTATAGVYTVTLANQPAGNNYLFSAEYTNLQGRKVYLQGLDSTFGRTISPYSTSTASRTTTDHSYVLYSSGPGTRIDASSTGVLSITDANNWYDGTIYDTMVRPSVATSGPKLSSVRLSQPGPTGNTVKVDVRFDGPVVNPTISYGILGSPTITGTLTLQADGSYTYTGNDFGNPVSAYVVRWSDASGRLYATPETSFRPDRDTVSTITTTSQTASGSGFRVTAAVMLGTAAANAFTQLRAQWRLAGSSATYSSTSLARASATTSNGSTTFTLTLGATTSLASGNYEIVVTGVCADGSTQVIEFYNYTVGAGGTTVTQQAVSWLPMSGFGPEESITLQNPADNFNRPAGFVDDSKRANDGRMVLHVPVLAPGTSHRILASFGQPAGPASLNFISSTPSAGTTDLTLRATLTAVDAASMDASGLQMHVYKLAGNTTDPSFPARTNVPVSATTTSGVFSATLTGLPTGTYAFSVFYTDREGRYVFVSFDNTPPYSYIAEVSTTTANQTVNVTPLKRLGNMNGGMIVRDAAGVVSTTDGWIGTGEMFLQTLDVTPLGFNGAGSAALTMSATGQPAGSSVLDAFAQGFSQTTVYNALNDVVATNQGDGLWRQFGIDASGNRVRTDLYGTPVHGVALTSFDAFDLRDRHIAHFDPAILQPDGSTRRPIERYTYDVFNNRASRMDAERRTWLYEYNALGSLVRETDALLNVLQRRVDIYGNVTRTISRLGFTTTNFYDVQGRLRRERDAEGFETGYEYDVFDRKIKKIDTRGLATATVDDYTAIYSYDNRNRLIALQEPTGNSQVYVYDRRDHRTLVSAAGQTTIYGYDEMGRLVRQESTIDGRAAVVEYYFDVYGNAIGQRDAMGRRRSSTYGQFGRLVSETDEDGNVVQYEYDPYGRLVREYSNQGPETRGKDIRRYYDAAGRQYLIEDRATGVNTRYTFYLTGQRRTEEVTTPAISTPQNVFVPNAGWATTIDTTPRTHNRSITYTYDANGQLTRWTDSVTGMHSNYEYDADGNRRRAYTDLNWNPVPGATRFLDNTYAFDRAGRLESITDRTGTVTTYDTDGVGNRRMADGWTYTFDANNRPTRATKGTETQTWSYDSGGRVLQFRHTRGTTIVRQTDTTYNEAGLQKTVTTIEEGKPTSTSTYTYDLSGRVTNLRTAQGSVVADYVYAYYGDGRERTITSTGQEFHQYATYDETTNTETIHTTTRSLNGHTTTELYDVNKIKKSIAKTQADGQPRPYLMTLLADNEGHILYKHVDDGVTRDSSNRARYAEREYLYVNGQPVGETGKKLDGNYITLLDHMPQPGQRLYSLVDTIGAEQPGLEQRYSVRAGDTLHSIAAAVYGNPTLWYVIADANGLTGSESLTVGMQLRLPDTVAVGALTAENHVVYNEGRIIGNVLPYPTFPIPKPAGKCAQVTGIIIAVIIAAVVAYATAGVGAAASGAIVGSVGAASSTAAAIGAGVATVGIYAAAGGVVNLFGQAIRSSLFGALGLNDDFDAGTSFLTGAASGAASGFSAAIAASSFTWAPVAEGALQAGAVFVGQLAPRGKWDDVNWTGVGAAFLGGALGGFGRDQKSAADAARRAAKANQDAGMLAVAARHDRVAGMLGGFGVANTFVTPFVALAESGMRQKGGISTMNVLGAVIPMVAQAGMMLYEEVSSGSASRSNARSARLARVVAGSDERPYGEPLMTINVYADEGPEMSRADAILEDSYLSDADFARRIDQLLANTEPNASDWTAGSLIKEFGSNAARAFAEPALQAYDLAQMATYVASEAMTAAGIIDRPYLPKFQSGLVGDIEQGDSAASVIPRQIPIVSIPFAAWDFGTALGNGVMDGYEGNWNQVAGAAGSLVGGALLGKSLNAHAQRSSQPRIPRSHEVYHGKWHPTIKQRALDLEKFTPATDNHIDPNAPIKLSGRRPVTEPGPIDVESVRELMGDPQAGKPEGVRPRHLRLVDSNDQRIEQDPNFGPRDRGTPRNDNDTPSGGGGGGGAFIYDETAYLPPGGVGSDPLFPRHTSASFRHSVMNEGGGGDVGGSTFILPPPPTEPISMPAIPPAPRLPTNTDLPSTRKTPRVRPGRNVPNPVIPKAPAVPKLTLRGPLLLPANAGPSHYFGNPVTLLNGPFSLFEGIEGAGAPRVFRDVSGEMSFRHHPDFGMGTMYGNPPGDAPGSYNNATYLFWKVSRGEKTFGDVVARNEALRAQGITGRSMFYSGIKYFGGRIDKFKFEYGGAPGADPSMSLNFKRYWEERAYHITAEEAAMRVPSASPLRELNFKRAEVLMERPRQVTGYYYRDGAAPTFRPYSYARNWVNLVGAQVDQSGNVSLPWWRR